jgi:uncharacterized SAM-binding protein YcdF (DUF218 family)
VPPSTNRPGGHFRRIFLVVAVVLVAGATFAALRLGTLLHAEDYLQRADAIFVLAGTRMERPLEAADLYLKGWAPRIIFTEDTPDGGAVALENRGLHLPTNAEVARDVLVRLGVPRDAVEVLPAIHDSTAHEADTFRRTVAARNWRRIIVVTSKFHTRRAGLAIRRELDGTGIDVLIRASSYDRADPKHWWRTRPDRRSAAIESQKLLAYALGLGM